MSKFTAFLSDESGASAAEYVLILAILGSAIAAGMVAFGGAVSTALNSAGAELQKTDFTP